jgi:Cytochrome c554 and c-prime
MFFPLLLFAAVSSARGADMTPPASAELCGRCHRGIHEAWKTSSHSQAMESRLFQDALALAEGDFGVEARKTCLECHAPIAVKIGDLRLEKR